MNIIVDRMSGWVAGLILLILSVVSAAGQNLPDQLQGHGGPIKSISISPDGERVLTSSFDYTIVYWDISEEKAQIIHRLEGHE